MEGRSEMLLRPCSKVSLKDLKRVVRSSSTFDILLSCLKVISHVTGLTALTQRAAGTLHQQ